MPKKKQKTNDESTLRPNWIMLTTPSTIPLIGSFAQIQCLTHEAIKSLIDHDKALYVPPAFDEMVECVFIDFKDSAFNCDGGLCNMVLAQVKNILVMNNIQAQKISPHEARFAMFSKLLK